MNLRSRLFPFQSSLETIRAHHWRNFTDAYSGCAFNCQYCLYKGPDDYGRHVKPINSLFAPSRELGIIDIGTNTDPYQPMEEKEQVTRKLLGNLLEAKAPVFVLTRGTLVQRDIDVLSDLASEGLVEVCISIITLNSQISARLEPRAPSPAERLRTAEILIAAGIPTSFHVAPMIAGLHDAQDWETLGRELGTISQRHIFAAVLGAQKGFWDTFYQLTKDIWQDFASWEQFNEAYPETLQDTLRGEAAATCTLDQILPSISALRAGALAGGAQFVSENYPFLTTAPQTGGIYRWKLPTVYDMAESISQRATWTDWDTFLTWYRDYNPTESLIQVVKQAWESGELFSGTHLRSKPSTRDGLSEYRVGTDLTAAVPSRTLVARKANPV